MAEAEPKDDDYKNRQPPSADYIAWLHGNADTESHTSPLHKTGTGPGDAAVGNHTHDGVNSPKLYTGVTFTGDLSTAAGLRNALKQVMAAMSGATDSTTN